MQEAIMAAIALTIALVVRRKDALALRWQPTRHTWVAVGTGLLAFLFSASILVVGTGTTAARLIHSGLIYLLCGFIIPWGYTLLVERGGVSGLGLTRHHWVLSLVLNLVLGALFSLIIIFEADLAAINWLRFARATVVLVGAGALFELFLYYGFIHLRLEKAFGTIPAILLTSAIYVLWHTGTQLPLEDNIPGAVVKLFAVGVLYQSIFSITHNLLTIWPFFLGVGVLIDFTVNIGEIELMSANFGWAVWTLVAMALVVLVTTLLARRPKPT
jgi:hypothetical protein